MVDTELDVLREVLQSRAEMLGFGNPEIPVCPGICANSDQKVLPAAPFCPTRKLHISPSLWVL